MIVTFLLAFSGADFKASVTQVSQLTRWKRPILPTQWKCVFLCLHLYLCVCVVCVCLYVCVHTSFFVALELIPELQPSADSSTYLTLPPTVILWRECESLNTSCHNGAPGHPMAWWPTSLTGITRACSRISSVCPCVTSVFAQVCGLIYTR